MMVRRRARQANETRDRYLSPAHVEASSPVASPRNTCFPSVNVKALPLEQAPARLPIFSTPAAAAHTPCLIEKNLRILGISWNSWAQSLLYLTKDYVRGPVLPESIGHAVIISIGWLTFRLIDPATMDLAVRTRNMTEENPVYTVKTGQTS
jgi:hypothetical protein